MSVLGGSIDFVNSSGATLTFEPNGFNPPLDQYQLSSAAGFITGTYFGVESMNQEPAPIPTPALLPGLIGMGAAALRKRKQEAEA